MPTLTLTGLLLALLGAGLVWLGSKRLRLVGWVLASVGGLALFVGVVYMATMVAIGEPVG